nr:MAG TPA: hypothetical protein [Caudoviricetes sp.]
MRFPWQGTEPHRASVRGACMPWLRTGSPRCSRRGAQRRAGTVASGVHPGMHAAEGARAQPRPTGRPLGRSDGGKQGADRLKDGTVRHPCPAILCDPRHG